MASPEGAIFREWESTNHNFAKQVWSNHAGQFMISKCVIIILPSVLVVWHGFDQPGLDGGIHKFVFLHPGYCPRVDRTILYINVSTTYVFVHDTLGNDERNK
jgi:hypothetical protein